MKRIFAGGFVFIFMCQSLWAAGPGTTNANFLKAGQGVRPIAMGESYIALGDGLDTLYWNPAGLVQMSSPTASFNHSFWLQEIGTEYLAYGMPLGPLGAVGGGLTYLHAGTIEKTTEDANGNYLGVDGSASAMSIALVGAYAQKLAHLMPIKDSFFSNVLVGASMRVVTESISEVSVFGGAVDLGAIWRQTEEIKPQSLATYQGTNQGGDEKARVRDNGFRAGLVAQNLGMTSDQLMPINFRAGVGYVLQDFISPTGRATVGVDALIPIDNDIKITIGAEYANISPNTEFAARIGYKIGNEIKDLDAMAGLTAGAGFAIAAGPLKYQIDYAFVPYGDLGITHRASLTLGFLPVENVVKTSASQKVVKANEGKPSTESLLRAKAAQKKPAVETSRVPETAATVPEPITPLPTAASAADNSAPVGGQADKVNKLRRDLNIFNKSVSARMLPPIQFETGKSDIAGVMKKSLDRLGKILDENKQGDVVIIGFAGADVKLAEARAKEVVRYLKMTFGVDPMRLSSKAGVAADQPKNSQINLEVVETK